MNQYNTGNPIGSIDPRDLLDNAQNLDEALLTDQATFTDRLGRTRVSWEGAIAYSVLSEVYGAGIEVTTRNQVILAGGEYWKVAGSTALPYTTTGAGMPEGGAFVSVGDAVLRQELAAGVGAGKGGLLVRGAVIYVNTIADLQALDTSALVDGQQVQVKDSGTYLWDLATTSWLQSTPGNVEYVDSNGTNFEASLQSPKKTVLGDGPYTLSGPFTPLTGKQIIGTSHYGPIVINCANGFINAQGVDGTNTENLRISGAGKGVAQNPLIDFNGGGSARQNRISQVYLGGADVGIAIGGGWHYQIDGLELRDLATGIKAYDQAGLGWSGSGAVFSNIYAGGCDVGVDDSYLWNAVYLNPIIENCGTPYRQNNNGRTSVIIAPWFEDNANAPEFRRDTVIIGGRGMDYSDISFFGDKSAITELRDGISIFRNVKNPVLKATGSKVINLNTDLGSVGFSPERVYDEVNDTYYTDGVRFSDASGDENRSIFGGVTASSGTVSNNSALSLEGYTAYWGSGVNTAIGKHSPTTRISLVGSRSGGNGGSSTGSIEFWTSSVTSDSKYEEKPIKRLSVTQSSLLPGEDGVYALGSSSLRYSEVFSATGAINTSDENLKTDIEDLDDIERSAANDLKKLIKKYKYKDSVEKKGDGARIHVGVIAQEVEQVFIDSGLDPSRYALFCRDIWYTYNGEIVDVNEDGDYIELKGEDPESCEGVAHPTQKHERLGIRYDELLAFIISAM